MNNPTKTFLLVLSGLLLASCHSMQRKNRLTLMEYELQDVQDSMRRGNFSAAERIISNGLSEATDSNTYYMWLCMRSKRYFTEMKADSFLLANNRTGDYLRRTPSSDFHTRHRLEVEWLVERGAFFAGMAGMPDSAIFYNKKALKRMDGLTNDTPYRIMALTNIADIYRQNGQLDLSADSYMQALAVADSAKLGNDTYIIIYMGISSVYTAMGDFKESKAWWERTGKLMPHMTQNDKFLYYNNRGNDYYQQGDYGKARACFEKAEATLKGNAGAEWDIAFVRTNLADVYIKLGMGSKARTLIDESEMFFRKVGFDIPLYYLDTQRIELALLDGDIKGASRLADAAEERPGMLPEQRIMRMKAVERAAMTSGQWEKAFSTAVALKALDDSINNNNMRMQMSTQLMQYEHDKRLMQQQQQIDHHRMTNRWIAAMLAAAVMAIALILSFMKIRQRRQRLKDLTVRQQIVSLRMMNTRNRITPHFIFNALNHEMLSRLNGSPSDLNALTQLLRMGIEQADILQTTLEEEINFIDYYVSIEKQQLGDGFKYTKTIDADVDITTVRLPSMTIQIFVENAIKHGLRPMKPQAGEARELHIRASRHGDSATLIEVTDNGCGMAGGKTPAPHTGIRIIKQTIQMLNEKNRQQITFGIESPEGGRGKGCRSWIMLPDDYDYTTV